MGGGGGGGGGGISEQSSSLTFTKKSLHFTLSCLPVTSIGLDDSFPIQCTL